MALTPEQKRSMDNYLYKAGNFKLYQNAGKKKEIERQEKSKAITEDILDGALRQIEDTNDL